MKYPSREQSSVLNLSMNATPCYVWGIFIVNKQRPVVRFSINSRVLYTKIPHKPIVYLPNFYKKITFFATARMHNILIFPYP